MSHYLVYADSHCWVLFKEHCDERFYPLGYLRLLVFNPIESTVGLADLHLVAKLNIFIDDILAKCVHLVHFISSLLSVQVHEGVLSQGHSVGDHS